ncbi:MAG: YlxR family protein [Thermoleophilia bacterium]
MCAGCGQRQDKRSLVRFAVSDRQGVLVLELDRTGRAPGRGAWLCPTEACLEKALKRDSIRRRLGAVEVAPGLREDFIELITDSDIANG